MAKKKKKIIELKKKKLTEAELQKSAEIAAGVTDAAKLDTLWEWAINGDAEKLDALRAKIAKVALQKDAK